MTRRSRLSRSPDRPRAAAVVIVALVGGVTARPRPAAAQACCVGTGLVTPARLRTFEDRAVGVQMRARSVMGAFGETGSYAATETRELGFEEDLFGALRLGRRFQVGLWAPFVQTSRAVPGVSGFGGGLGDVAASARFDALDAGTRGYWPGLALLAGITLPTGTPPDEAGDPLATSSTGTGSYDASVGLALEEIAGRGFLSAAGWVSNRSGRAVMGVEQSFAPSLSALLSGGFTFGHETTVGAFVSLLRRGDASDATGAIANSGVALATAGAAMALPFWDSWRLQATAFTDLPIPGWGRNQTVGFGGTLAIIRFWI